MRPWRSVRPSWRRGCWWAFGLTFVLGLDGVASPGGWAVAMLQRQRGWALSEDATYGVLFDTSS